MNQDSHMMPFLWLHGEDEATLRRGIQDIADSGCKSLCAESRTHPDFMGPDWWREIDILTDECHRLGLTYWLLDDTHFPSGYANGSAKGTPLCRMMMTERRMDMVGPRKGGRILVQADGAAGMLVAVVAGRRLCRELKEDFVDQGGWALTDLIDLTDRVQDGFVRWDVPEGEWRVFVLTARYVSERNPPQFFANPLLPEGGQLMIDAVYEPHYAHLKDEFGKTFRGFFSDEPALRAGRGCRAVLGEYPQLPIPWRMDLPELLSAHLGENARVLLPGLWYDIGEKTARIRYALMDTVSSLYAENYSMRLGNWCRAHGVEYIGHVIEQNNAHSRLGQGAGHFFRALSGQDMAGMDLVLHELRPDFRNTSHAWNSQDFEADDDFFRYMIAQMTVSCAQLDPKKMGRSLCEIFGAYGWQEDVGEMRYLVNFLFSRGINHFVPHAFSLKPLPDPDSPPHFGRFNPLMPAIGRLFGHMERTAALLDGGKADTRVGVLYYAEAEWAQGKSCMKTQALVKQLALRQIACEIVPIDQLTAGRYDVLYIPKAKLWPEKLFHRLHTLMDAGCRVVFVDALPEGLSEGMGDMAALTAGTCIVPLDRIAADALACASLSVRSLSNSPDIYCYPYRKDGKLLLALFNEDTREAHDITLRVEKMNEPVAYDPEQECCERLSDGERLSLTLEPGQLLLVGEHRPDWPSAQEPRRFQELASLSPSWKITFPGTELAPLCTDAPEDLNAIYPRFSGTARYETELFLPEGCEALLLPAVSGAVNVWLDGEAQGHRVASPYRFPARSGRHQLVLEITNTLVFAHRDELSFFHYINPTGLTGPVFALEVKP